MKLRVKNWAKHQHYKNRLPPWIKLHSDLLKDFDFMCLPIASKALAPLLWLLASEQKDGVFDASMKVLKFRLHMTEKEINEGLKPLIDNGYFSIDSGMLADCKQLATPETETETEREGVASATKKSKGKRFDLETIPTEWIEFCKKERGDLNPEIVFESFSDYWISVAGQKGVKADWFATWRNWVRNQKQGFVVVKPSVVWAGAK